MTTKEEKIKALTRFFDELLSNTPEFTGHIQTNFFKGGITNVNQVETKKIKVL